MTSASGIASAAAALPGGAKAKLPESVPDDISRFDTNEFAAFSELFAYIESEEKPAEAAVSAPAKDDGKRAEEEDKTSPIQLAEMTHYLWFCGKLAMPAPDAAAPPRGDRLPALPEPGENKSADPLAAVRSALNLDLPAPVREFVARSAVMRVIPNAASPGTGTTQKKLPVAAMPALSDEAAEAVQTSALPAPQPVTPPMPQVLPAAQVPPAPQPPPAPVASVSANALETASETPRQSTPAAAIEPRQQDRQDTYAKASLLALETALSRGGAATKDIADRGPDRPFSPPPLHEVRVSIIQQETHFAPSQPQPPVFQIADRVDQHMRSIAMETLQQPASDPRPDAGPLRVLHIQLDPPQLGPLTIRIALKDGALNLQLETARHETAALIQTDKDTLSGLLRSAGYVVDGLNVQVATPDRTVPSQYLGGGMPGGFNQTMGQQSGSRQSDGRSLSRAPAAGGQEDGPAGGSHEKQGPQTGKPRGGSLYL